jgi:hypothetical protein
VIAIGNDELGMTIPAGARIKCPRATCRTGSHRVAWGTSKGVESRLLAFYRCGQRSFLCGVNGRLLPGEALSDD